MKANVILLLSAMASLACASPSAAAPACPATADLDLMLRPIDFIDCTNEADDREFNDQGASSVVTGPAGRYRQTAAHRHAFFAYTFRTAGKDKPVLIVFEYPDDAERTINFSTHEAALSGRANRDWSLETGVYTGGPFPLSNAMQYHTFIMYPQGDTAAALVGDFHRYAHPAAASRIWVFAIEGGLPKLDVDAPDPSDQRRLAHFNSFAFLPTAFHFGYRSPNAIEHMLDYCQYVGVNHLAWCVAANNAWGVWCEAPSLPNTSTSRDHLEKVLKAMDARGGFSFTACFGPEKENSFVYNGKNYLEMTADELRESTIKLLDEIIDRYGEYASFQGLGLGSQYDVRFYKRLQTAGVVQDVVDHVKARRPDLEVLVFAGGLGLHQQYFDHTGPSAESVYRAFETSDRPWPAVLAEKAHECWKLWDQDPAVMNTVKGLTVYEQYQPDDFRIFGLYSQQPREAMYFDLDQSQARSDLVASHYAALWNTHFEGWYGLHPEVNFPWQKLWVAPDFNAPSPLSLASFARAMGHRDRLAIMPGSWNNKYFGYEGAVRRFAKAFRSLPPEPMTEATDSPLDTVKVRWLLYKGKRHIAVQSLIPFPSKVMIDGEAVALAPYALAALADDGDRAPTVTGKAPDAYVTWVAERILRLQDLAQQVGALDAKAAPPAYAAVTDKASALLLENRPYAADMLVGLGLTGELQLRKDILDPPALAAPRLKAAPPMTGDLDAWPAEAADIRAEGGEHLAGHLYFPNSWTGPDDLSARIRLGHDGQKLYVAAAIRDDKLVARDGCAFRLSTDGAYLDWTDARRVSDVTWTISLPVGEVKSPVEGEGAAGFRYTCRRTAAGYVVEGAAPLAELDIAPGGSLGFLLNISDDDDTPNRYKAGWAVKQVLLAPHKPNFQYWDDVRNCGKLTLGR